jgi:hypothetical protein
MKMRCFAAVLALLTAAGLGAQEGAGLLSAGDLDGYAKPFLNNNGLLSRTYIRAANEDELNKVSALSGDIDVVDTPLEIALLSTCAGVVDVRPVMAPEVAAILPANNPKLSDLKLGAAVYQEMQVLRFLGNTAAVGRHEGIIKFITDRGNVSRAEIVDYLKQGIAEVVNAEFNKVSFILYRYGVSLTRTNGNQYILSCKDVNDVVKEFPPASLEALLDTMRNNRTEFESRDIDTVRANAALIPGAIFDGWKKTTTTMVNPYDLLTRALTNFYITPSNENYRVVRGIYARARLAKLTDGDTFTDNMLESIEQILKSFNQELLTKMGRDLYSNREIIAAAGVPDEPQYGIFTLNRESGDAIFVSKTRSAPGLLQR